MFFVAPLTDFQDGGFGLYVALCLSGKVRPNDGAPWMLIIT
jgi:hypothetical protein